MNIPLKEGRKDGLFMCFLFVDFFFGETNDNLSKLLIKNAYIQR